MLQGRIGMEYNIIRSNRTQKEINKRKIRIELEN